ncbi:hypothetical protein ACQGS6_28115, partial [Bacillus sp. GMs2/2]
MMDFIGEIQKIEKEIEKATVGAVGTIIDELQAVKKQLEKELQQSLLKTDVAFKTNSIVASQKHAIQKNKEAFHDVCKSLSEQGIELNKSFESKTGSAIKETLNKHLNQIRNEMISK